MIILSVFGSSILLKVCSLLRNRAQEIRDIARNTLMKIMEALGAQYLQYVLKEMHSTLVHGYQVMVLVLFLLVSLDPIEQEGYTATSELYSTIVK